MEPAGADASLSVVIAVLTYKRPDDLRIVLPQLIGQSDDVRATARVRVLVIDNDPAGSAETTVDAYRTASPPADAGRVGYVNETTPGIAAARNRALEGAADDDVLVFIDDDERPTDGWLAGLLTTFRTHGSTAVAGPVVSEYEVEPSPWLAAGDFFSRRRHPTGAPLEVAATNNLLLDMHEIRRMGLTFDVELGLTGGSDTLFTRGIRAAGGTLTWCDEAVVIDVVPASRLTRRWVLRRALRSGNSWSLTSLMLSRNRLARLEQRVRLTATGSVRIAGGFAQLAAGVATRSMRRRARGQRTVARGAGMAAGAWGYVYREYKRPS
jgi:succinoglycan biosynthesis protein ExoM